MGGGTKVGITKWDLFNCIPKEDSLFKREKDLVQR